MHTRSYLVRQTQPAKHRLLHQPRQLSSGAATSRATDPVHSRPISCGCTPIEQRTASAPTSTSDPPYAATRRTHASTSAEPYRQWDNPERTPAEVGARMSKALGVNR